MYIVFLIIGLSISVIKNAICNKLYYFVLALRRTTDVVLGRVLKIIPYISIINGIIYFINLKTFLSVFCIPRNIKFVFIVAETHRPNYLRHDPF